jgi:hypothetical protein
MIRQYTISLRVGLYLSSDSSLDCVVMSRPSDVTNINRDSSDLIVDSTLVPVAVTTPTGEVEQSTNQRSNTSARHLTS